MTFNDFKRLIDPLKRKIFLLIGRAILTAVSNSESTQKIQVTGLDDETISDVERLQNFGFDSYPKTTNSQAVIGFVNGNRDQGIALVVQDNDNRPTDLQEGDVRVYDANGSFLKLQTTGVELSDGVNTLSIKFEVTGITISTTDAAGWLPNVLAVDPVTGIPHGGAGGGIVKLKGA